jgi:MFS family permease
LQDQALSKKSGDRSQLIAFIVAVAFFMENLDGTAIATALPQMALSFGVSPTHLSIGITAYLVTLAIFIPISGWIADRYGARTVFGVAIAVFTIASVFCGVSTGLTQFILARILQGIGGAMMVPVGRIVVLGSKPKNQLISAIETGFGFAGCVARNTPPAQFSGVRPSLSLTSSFAPRATRKRMMSSEPRFAAPWIAVRPIELTALTPMPI